MKAVVFDGQLKLEKRYPDPSPGPGEVLVQIRYAGICATDLEITAGYLNFSGVLGHEFVGVVVGGSERWLGKRVVGEINCTCGSCDMCSRGLAGHCRDRTVVGIVGRDGAFAEYLVLPERNCHHVPDVLPDQQAVFIEPVAAACQILKQCPIDKHQRVAVLGGGKLGSLVAQVLQRTGCTMQVIGRSPQRLQFCEKRGIATTTVQDLLPRADHDLVIDCTGHPRGLALALELVRPRGTIVLKSTHAAREAVDLTPLVVNEVTLLGSRCGPFSDAITALAREQVQVETLISRIFDLSDAVEAFTAARDPENMKILLRMPTPEANSR